MGPPLRQADKGVSVPVNGRTHGPGRFNGQLAGWQVWAVLHSCQHPGAPGSPEKQEALLALLTQGPRCPEARADRIRESTVGFTAKVSLNSTIPDLNLIFHNRKWLQSTDSLKPCEHRVQGSILCSK